MSVKTLTEENFNSEVLEATGVVMVDFGAEWCAPCKVLEPIVTSVAAEVSFKVVKVDVDDCPTVASKFGVRGVPTIMIFKDGKVLKSIVGVTSKAALIKFGEI